MTKRLTIALVALAIFVLVATLPVSAAKVNDGNTNVYYYQVAQNINAGATVFIGEQHLNLASFAAPGTQIGWWSTGQDPLNEGPALSLIISNPADFEVPASVGGAGPTANWYVVNPATGHSTGILAVRSVDPSLDLNIWDTTIGA